MLSEQLVLVMHPRWMVQADDVTPLALAGLTAVVPVTMDSKSWLEITREFKETFDCTDENLADRKVRSQTAKLRVTIKVTPEIAFAFIAASRGTSAAPVNNGDGTYTHASARTPAYDFDLPPTTMVLADAKGDGFVPKVLRAVRCVSWELTAEDNDYWTMAVVLDVYPEYTEDAEFIVPACADTTYLDLEDSTLTDSVNGSLTLEMFSARARFDNNLREGRYRHRSAGKNPTAAHRGARRADEMEFLLNIGPDHPISEEIEAGTQTDHIITLRAGTATANIQISYPKARLQGGVRPEGDQRPLVARVTAVPLKAAGVVSNVSSRNTQSLQYLPAAA